MKATPKYEHEARVRLHELRHQINSTAATRRDLREVLDEVNELLATVTLEHQDSQLAETILDEALKRWLEVKP